MKKLNFLLLILTIITMSAPSFSAEIRTLGSLSPFGLDDELNTGPFDCGVLFAGEGTFQVTVAYTMPVTLKLKAVNFFAGAWRRTKADITWELWNDTTGQIIYWTLWDRYDNPTQPQGVMFHLPAGDWITLNKGDIIMLRAGCGDLNLFGFRVKAHVAATLYGVVVP